MNNRQRNPKDAAAIMRAPLNLIPAPPLIPISLALANGAGKYGKFNWRATAIEASSYIAATQRHIASWYDGEEYATDSGVHHLGHACASLMILMDAGACDMMVDDRPPPAPTAALLAAVAARTA
jgi:hypothetical protein